MKDISTHYRLNMPLRSEKEVDSIVKLAEALQESTFSQVERMMHFPLYSPRQSISSFLVRYELFKRIINIHGSIIECGVGYGSGLMSFAHFSAIFEPVNHTRKIFGFDTFEGFTKLSGKDRVGQDPNAQKGGMRVDSFAELTRCINIFDQNRFIGHINKVELVKGDITKTAPEYLKNNPHLVVALLYLDLDLYEPTKIAIQTFLPRMPKGAIIAFDELNHPDWPGETLAVLENMGINKLKIERFPFDSVRSFAVLE